MQFNIVSASSLTDPSWLESWSESIPTIYNDNILTTPSFVSLKSLAFNAEWDLPSNLIISLTANAQEHKTDHTSFSSNTFFYCNLCRISFSNVWSRYS
jgi:hypothetical protein